MKLIGETEGTAEVLKISRAHVSNDLVNSILAVLHVGDENDDENALEGAKSDIPQHLVHSNIAGFVWVVQVDSDRDILTVLAPCPGALPSKYLLVGSIKWVE